MTAAGEDDTARARFGILDVVWHCWLVLRRDWKALGLVTLLYWAVTRFDGIASEISYWTKAGGEGWIEPIRTWVDGTLFWFLHLLFYAVVVGLVRSAERDSLARVHAAVRAACRRWRPLLLLSIVILLRDDVLHWVYEGLGWFIERPQGPAFYNTEAILAHRWYRDLADRALEALMLAFFLPLVPILVRDGVGLGTALIRSLRVTRGSRIPLFSLLLAVELFGCLPRLGFWDRLPWGTESWFVSSFLLVGALLALPVRVALDTIWGLLPPVVERRLQGMPLPVREPPEPAPAATSRTSRPLSPGAMIGRAVTGFAKDPLAFLFCGLVVVLPTRWVPGSEDSFLLSDGHHLAGSCLLTLVVAAIVSTAAVGPTGRSPRWLQIGLREVREAWLPLLEFTVLLFLLLVKAAGMVAGYLTPVLGFLLDESLGWTGVSFAWDVAPGLGTALALILLTMMALAVPAIVREKRALPSALRRSAELTRGHRVKLFFLFVVLAAVEWIARWRLPGGELGRDFDRSWGVWFGYFGITAVLVAGLGLFLSAAWQQLTAGGDESEPEPDSQD